MYGNRVYTMRGVYFAERLEQDLRLKNKKKSPKVSLKKSN